VRNFRFCSVNLTIATYPGTQKFSDSDDDKRNELKDTMSDCVEVIGAHKCLQIVCTHLEREMRSGSNGSTSTIQWQNVEALLLAAQCIAPFVTDLNESSVVFTQLINFVPTLPNFPGLAIAVIDLLGKSSRWLKTNAQCLQSVMPHLFGSLSNALISSYR
jgi:hypothetical protein